MTRGRKSHRAVATIIATIFIVMIAVVGGTTMFVFSQEFYGQSQISGIHSIELVNILGYDARDIVNLNAHDGTVITVPSGDPNLPGKNTGERVVIYVKNEGDNQILFSEIRLGGEVYTYNTVDPIPAFSAGTGGTYGVMTNSTDFISSPWGVILPYETVGILIDLTDSFPISRDTQFKLTTTKGAVFVDTVVMGQNVG